MENYKVKFSSEAESKEVQELFEQLSGLKYKNATIETRIGMFALENGSMYSDYMSHYDDYDCEEITIPQLRDLVVLKRNSIEDATHKIGERRYYLTTSEFFEFINGQWVNIDEFVDGLSFEPIKEYLVKENGTYVLHVGGIMPDGAVEVPEGAECAVIFNENDLYFYKGNYFSCLRTGWDWGDANEKIKGCGSSSIFNINHVWQRPKQPEELPLIDDEPKVTFDTALANAEEITKVLRARKNKADNQSLNDQYAEIEQVRQAHSHYYIDVSDVNEIDFYEIALRYNVTDPCIQHILKKCLAVGNRGHKDFKRDLQDIADTAQRALKVHKV